VSAGVYSGIEAEDADADGADVLHHPRAKKQKEIRRNAEKQLARESKQRNEMK
jgi:hypothetical protein